VLVSVSEVIPPEVWLVTFDVEGKKVTFRGGAVGFNQISDFMRSLSGSAYFTNLNLVQTQQEKLPTGLEVTTFELKAMKR